MKTTLSWSGLGIVAALMWSGPSASAQILPDFTKPKVDAEDLKLAEGKRKDDGDLRCLDGGTYIGGIDRAWSLLISGPPRRRFYYSFVGTSTVKLEGTYEAKDNLAVFTGTIGTGPAFGEDKDKKMKAEPIRFALNYTFLDDKVYFNVLRTGDGNYVYQRQWFAKTGDKWQLREERQLMFLPKKRTDTEITFDVKGERRLWEDKAPKKIEIKETLTYKMGDDKYWRLTNPPEEKWLPQVLRPQWSDAQKKGLPVLFHLSPGGFGQVRGFTFGEQPN